MPGDESNEAQKGATTKKPKKEKKLTAKDIKRNKDFAEAVRKLWNQYETWQAAAEDLDPLIHEDTVRRLYRSDRKGNIPVKMYTDPSEIRVDDSQKDRLIWYYSDGPERFVYRRIADTIRQNPAIKKAIILDAKGDYIYFRYMLDTSTGEEKYVDGDIKIYEQNGIPKFDHRSDEFRKSENPEHSGPIFRGGSYLFLVGVRPNVLRLAICDAPNINDGYMTGLVVSIRSDFPNDPFAARFVMVKVDQEDLISELKDKTKNPQYNKLDENGIRDNSKTLGEKKFFDLTRGSYAYFMLSKHKNSA